MRLVRRLFQSAGTPIAVMELSRNVVPRVCLSIVAFANSKIWFANLAIAEFSMDTLCVPRDCVCDQCRHRGADSAGGTLASPVHNVPVADRKSWRGLFRFLPNQNGFRSFRHRCHVLVRSGACSGALRNRKLLGVPDDGAGGAASRNGSRSVCNFYTEVGAENLCPDQDRILQSQRRDLFGRISEIPGPWRSVGPHRRSLSAVEGGRSSPHLRLGSWHR